MSLSPSTLEDFYQLAHASVSVPKLQAALKEAADELQRVETVGRYLRPMDPAAAEAANADLLTIAPVDLHRAFKALHLPERGPDKPSPMPGAVTPNWNWGPLYQSALRRGRWGSSFRASYLRGWIFTTAENAKVTPFELFVTVLRLRDHRLAGRIPAYDTPPSETPHEALAALKLSEIAERISSYLREFAADPSISPKGSSTYWNPGAWVGGSRVAVMYVSFQSKSTLTRAEALTYLAWLDDGNVGPHYEALRSVKK